MEANKFDVRAGVLKVDEALGLVIGFGIITAVDGEPYFDTQGDHIPDDGMLKAATDFMLKSRATTDMHARGAAGEVVPDGQVVFAFPLTAEIATALEITTKRTGLLVAIKPSAAVLAKYRDGTYTGFSVGGARIDETVVEE